MIQNVLSPKKIEPEYHITRAIWEITNACNMHCKHCGSSSGKALPNELSTEEALSLCDQIAAFGIKGVNLTGGEPFVRSDWYQIVQRLVGHKVMTSIITNGWLIDEALVEQISDLRLNNICISLDGAEKNHDLIRKPGTYKRVVQAFELLKKYKVPTACITTVNRQNFADLPEIEKLLVDKGVQRWQIQLAMPMGNLQNYLDIVLQSEDISKLVMFCHKIMLEGEIIVHLGDNIGYYSTFGEEEIRESSDSEDKNRNFSFAWKGCHAGKRILGIRADGWVVGCLALRDSKYFEGNIRQQSLAEICHKPEAFAWHRRMKKEDLRGFCRECSYGDICLGGCNAQKEAFYGSAYAENPTCLYKWCQLTSCEYPRNGK